MAEASSYAQFTASFTYEGRYIQYNVLGNSIVVTSKYWPPIKPIGCGAYGIVCSVLNTETNERVAIKKIAHAFDNVTDAKRTLREIKILRHFDHENIIALRDVVPPPSLEDFSDVYFATELMDTDMHQIIRSEQVLSEDHNQYFLYQILRGLKYIHSANVIHRDLKPSNLLLNANTDLKICDFGLARPVSEDDMTMYVVTRYYRAPELLLYSSNYTAAIDIWSVGCILMELMTRKPLFPGKDRDHQMRLVIELLGTPSELDLQSLTNEGGRRYIRQLPPKPRQPLSQVYPHLNPLAIDLVEKMLMFDPTRRITVEEALSHPYLAGLRDISDEPTCSEPFSFDLELATLEVEDIKEMIYNEALAFNPTLNPQYI
ncbi:mitogen-activated protein kinase 3-like [Silene latifolia]|uniref:mitogen-activated protein kinase 3-like n=1 Tax=Silene latifolia TaxID=37657 RepID=UPI003D77C7E3